MKLMNWFLNNIKPFSQHLTLHVMQARKFEQDNKEIRQQRVLEVIEDNAETVQLDMDIILQALTQLNTSMGTSKYLADQESMTILDIMVYNELAQALFLYDMFKKSSKSGHFTKVNQASPDGTEADLILEFENIEKWFNRTMQSDKDVSTILQKYADELRAKFSREESPLN
mmetsp:Transcript_2726/g.4633  ORF Transcript_2726/g.4633 Transcript_2726/m.4633 type:complete len:171 (-) Transcript_2726:38-550(-)